MKHKLNLHSFSALSFDLISRAGDTFPGIPNHPVRPPRETTALAPAAGKRGLAGFYYGPAPRELMRNPLETLATGDGFGEFR